MSAACIVTDTSAQFAKQVFTGRSLVHRLRFHVSIDGREVEEDTIPEPDLLPASYSGTPEIKISPPTVDDYLEIFNDLSGRHQYIFAISSSGAITGSFANLEKAVRGYHGKSILVPIDSLTFGAGLGVLIQYAASHISRSSDFPAIEKDLRGVIPHIYCQCFLPHISYLQIGGFLEKSQGMLAEALGILPVFAVEDGRLLPVDKLKSIPLLQENLQEFVDEFDQLDQVLLVHGAAGNYDPRPLRDYVSANLSGTSFSDIAPNFINSVLLGLDAVCLFAVEKSIKKNL